MLGKLKDMKYKRKYTTMCVKFAEIANKNIKQLEEDRDILLQNIKYKDALSELKDELAKYRKKYGKLEGGDENGKNKS